MNSWPSTALGTVVLLSWGASASLLGHQMKEEAQLLLIVGGSIWGAGAIWWQVLGQHVSPFSLSTFSRKAASSLSAGDLIQWGEEVLRVQNAGVADQMEKAVATENGDTYWLGQSREEDGGQRVIVVATDRDENEWTFVLGPLGD